MSIQDALAPIFPYNVNSYQQFANIMKHASVDFTFWGESVVTVIGYAGSIPLYDLAHKVEILWNQSQKPMIAEYKTNPRYPTERKLGKAIFTNLKRLWTKSFHLKKEKNC